MGGHKPPDPDVVIANLEAHILQHREMAEARESRIIELERRVRELEFDNLGLRHAADQESRRLGAASPWARIVRRVLRTLPWFLLRGIARLKRWARPVAADQGHGK